MRRFEKIHIDKIDVGSRIRKNLDNLELLAKSISSLGLLHPITVKPKGNGWYQLLAGFRRKKAHELLGLDRIMAHIVDEDEK